MTRVSQRPAARVPLLMVAVALLAGCGAWFGDPEDPPLPGERSSILLQDAELAPDPRIARQPVVLPPPYRNLSWTQAGGGPLHAVGHVEGPVRLARPAWRASIGAGAASYRPLLSNPVVAGGRVFTMDTKFRVSAFDAGKGKRLWRTALEVPGRDDEAFGGGLAYDGGRIYVSTGFAEVAALEADDGKLVWQRPVNGPVHGPPLVMDGQVFVVTLDNQLVALSAETGDVAWRHAGFAEPAALLGQAAPAGLEGTVIAPYSSGEIFALRAPNGRPTWADNLASVRRIDAASALADIRAHPVTDGNLVYAVSHSGRTAAINLRTGARAWDRNLGGVQTPWLAGDWVFLVTNENQLVCLTRRDGRVRWIAQLDRYEDREDHSGPIHWTGPMLIAGRLLLLGYHGVALSVDPADGSVVDRFDIADEVMAAAVADATLYLQTADGDLLAYR